MSKPKSNSLVTDAVNAIEGMISSGRLVPGQRLIEADLCEQLGIGRVPVREALRVLSGDGLIELVPNRGARVRPISSKTIAELLETVSALLFTSAEAFTSSPTWAEDLPKLVDISEQMQAKTTGGDVLGLLDLIRAYHGLLFEATQNTVMIDLHERLRFGPYYRQLADLIGDDVMANTANMYREVTKAFAARDAVRASELLRSPMHNVTQVLRGK